MPEHQENEYIYLCTVTRENESGYREVAHLGVINNSQKDHRDYTDKTAEGRNHSTQLGKKQSGEMQQDPA